MLGESNYTRFEFEIDDYYVLITHDLERKQFTGSIRHDGCAGALGLVCDSTFDKVCQRLIHTVSPIQDADIKYIIGQCRAALAWKMLECQ